MKQLAGAPLPPDRKPDLGSAHSCVRSRYAFRSKHSKPAKRNSICCPSNPASGLPVFPSCLEATSFPKATRASAAWRGPFGYFFAGDRGKLRCQRIQAFSREDEKRAFQKFADFAMRRRGAFPDLAPLRSAGPISGSGLRCLPVEREGNWSDSPQDADAASALAPRTPESGAARLRGLQARYCARRHPRHRSVQCAGY